MRTAPESWGCWARRTDPAMATAGSGQMSSTSRVAGSAEGLRTALAFWLVLHLLDWHPQVGLRRLGAGRTLTGFEARGRPRQLKGL